MKKAAAWLVAALVAFAVTAPGASAGPTDPLFTLTPADSEPPLVPPPAGNLEGPCGLAVDASGRFYVSDYHHDVVDVFDPNLLYQGQLASVDPLDGPCGLALDAGGRLYVNDFHRAVLGFGAYPAFGSATTIAGAPLDGARPTGVAADPLAGRVYVNERTHVAVYDESGAVVMDGSEPLRIGAGSLQEGYGLAVSGFPATKGRLYVPDADTDTVKIYDPAISKSTPVATISGAATPNGAFSSLRDGAIAVDRVSGNVYVADDLQPAYTERPQAVVHVFSPAGGYLGHLKHLILDARPPGLAVDNSSISTQGRVYVTSGNTENASVIGYPAGAETTAPPICALAITCPPGATTVGAKSAGAGAEPAVEGCGSGCETTAQRTGWAGASAIAQKGTLRVSVAGRLSPQRLPRAGAAPISVMVGGKVSTTDQSLPPRLEGLRIEINRQGRLDHKGLPTCPYEEIHPASSARALAACRNALVGQGGFSANIELSGQEPYPTQGKLLVFNGRRGGRPVLFGHIYAPRPFATSFVIVFKLQKLAKGSYGTALAASLPKALGKWGNLTGIEMTLSRRYVVHGEHRSFLSAGCPAPAGFPGASFPLARASFAFEDGVGLSSVLDGSCKVRG
jgi:DNA-binding beta-propeller fold protein YncE